MSSTCATVHEKVVLLKTEFPPVAIENTVFFCLRKEAEPIFDVSNEKAISIVCTAPASELLCLLTFEFHVVTVGVQL